MLNKSYGRGIRIPAVIGIIMNKIEWFKIRLPNKSNQLMPCVAISFTYNVELKDDLKQYLGHLRKSYKVLPSDQIGNWWDKLHCWWCHYDVWESHVKRHLSNMVELRAMRGERWHFDQSEGQMPAKIETAWYDILDEYGIDIDLANNMRVADEHARCELIESKLGKIPTTVVGLNVGVVPQTDNADVDNEAVAVNDCVDNDELYQQLEIDKAVGQDISVVSIVHVEEQPRDEQIEIKPDNETEQAQAVPVSTIVAVLKPAELTALSQLGLAWPTTRKDCLAGYTVAVNKLLQSYRTVQELIDKIEGVSDACNGSMPGF